MGGGSKPQTQTQTTEFQLSPEQRELLTLALPNIREFMAKVPERYGGSQVAGFDPLQTQGQEQVLGAASGPMQGLADKGAYTSNFLMGDIWNPETNPHLQGAIDASIRPITERYQNVVRPAIRDEFSGAGQVFGGSRRNISESLGANDYMRNVGDTGSKLVQDQYANNLNANVKALALLPQTLQAQLAPGLATSGVGDVRQAQSQAELDDLISGFNYDQLAPFLQSKEVISLLSGIPGGTNVSTATAAGKSPWTSAMGGAVAGGTLGSALGPWGTAGGAAAGGLMGYFA